jgi:hypothetical protein
MKGIDMTKGLSIPHDVADGITLTVLQDHHNLLTTELKKHKEGGSWMHPDDVKKNEDEIIPALETLIEYFGGDV